MCFVFVFFSSHRPIRNVLENLWLFPKPSVRKSAPPTVKFQPLRGDWVAQSVEHPTLDFSSGYDARVVGSSPGLGSSLTREPA